mgnify:FL=1
MNKYWFTPKLEFILKSEYSDTYLEKNDPFAYMQIVKEILFKSAVNKKRLHLIT